MPGTSKETGHGTKSEKLASLRSASDTRISGRVLATRLSGRLGTDAVPPDAQWSTDGLTDKKWASPYASGRSFSSEWVGAYCIRPIRRSRQGDECGFWVVSRGIYWDQSSPTVPDCGAYAIRPYASGSRFLSVRVGRNSIRPIGRPRQGGECGYPVISQGD